MQLCIHHPSALLTPTSTFFYFFILIMQVSRASADRRRGPSALPRELLGSVPPQPPHLPVVPETGDEREQGRRANRRVAPRLPGKRIKTCIVKVVFYFFFFVPPYYLFFCIQTCPRQQIINVSLVHYIRFVFSFEAVRRHSCILKYLIAARWR